MKNFSLWLLRKIGSSIISFPKSHFKFYKHGLYHETGLFLAYTVGRYLAAGLALALIGTAINTVFTVHSDTVILYTTAILYCYYTIELIGVILSIQYDNYCSELQQTHDALKRTEYNDTTPAQATARYNMAQPNTNTITNATGCYDIPTDQSNTTNQL
jgi:hypothetical protein